LPETKEERKSDAMTAHAMARPRTQDA